MELYLIRHGIARDRRQWDGEEFERPLTEKGHLRTQQVAARLKSLGLRFSTLLTSPLTRAKQTAEILQEAGLGQSQDFSPLAPEGRLEDWIEWYSQQAEESGGPIALVGHQPDLGNWAEKLVWGENNAKLILKKAGIIGIEFPADRPYLGHGQLFLLISPKWLL
ncbi:MAG: phosphohistidine phosphatase SixA [Chloroflexaceae bacterium]|nr:phosphohistidine phosphatase SixA [Chloroflexaceae bacterium]